MKSGVVAGQFRDIELLQMVMRVAWHMYLYNMTNRLINEQSPYLLQHAHNPVAWYPWGDEPFKRALEENKPVLVSIGYAACHWCHVMERESFEDEAIAAYMNAQFICIKVDREEHPDVDHFYMDAVQAMNGSGGWPLNVFTTPEKIPFYGGTYFPPRPAYSRPSWIQVLQWINQLWTEQEEEVKTLAQQMIAHLRQASKAGFSGIAGQLDMDVCRKIADKLLMQADTVSGGFGQAPKFPGSMAISFLLEHYHFTGYESALRQALLSLDAMINGGIYDQLGGGFARYSTDTKWLVPHFEKMLYDNALIVSAMCDAYFITKEQRYKVAIEETIAFVERELKGPSGAHYSALDADSEGEEGKYYTWTWEEWLEALGEENEMVAAYFGVSEKGNWEGVNILHVPGRLEDVAKKYSVRPEALLGNVNEAKQKLFSTREKRVRPLTDDKSLLSWNALMNIALSKAGIALAEEKYLTSADEHMRWMLANFQQDGNRLRTWKNGYARIGANLDDNAYLAQALLQLASATGNNEWIKAAAEVIEETIERFLHEDGIMFYYTSSAQDDIPVRKVDIYDGAMPSANAVMVGNLLIAGLCMERYEWVEIAIGMLQKTAEMTVKYSYSFGYWALMLQRYATKIKTVVCAGPFSFQVSKELQRYLLPQCYILTSEKEISEIPVLKNKILGDKVYIFVCSEAECLAPESDTERVLQLLKQ